MGSSRKLPPAEAAEHIRRLAAEGYGQLGIAAHFNVSRDCFKRWVDEDEALNEAYELGKETERQALHAMIVASAKANKSANVNAFFLLKARHGYVETDNRTKVSLDVAINNVLVVRDHGTDEEWAAKAAAQQRTLTAPESTSPQQIEASIPAHVDAVAAFEPADYLPPVYAPVSAPAPIPAPVAPSWAAPVQASAPVAAVASPGYDWLPQPVPARIYAPEAIRSAPVAPSWPVQWRPKA